MHARSTPGFIVNRIARPYYAEALALLLERAAEPAVLDACLRGGGFRMGPCELMDLIGHDTNFAVTESVFAANFFDKRYAPSLVQREMVDGGLLGRKSGRGFFAYPARGGEPAAGVRAAAGSGGRDRLPARPRHRRRPLGGTARRGRPHVRVRSGEPLERPADRPRRASPDRRPRRRRRSRPRKAFATWRCSTSLTARNGGAPGVALAYSVSAGADAAWREEAGLWLRIAGWTPQPVGDAPGLVVARTVAMLVNEACDAVLQGVCTPEGADLAMKLGVNYPQGPFEFLAAGTPTAIAACSIGSTPTTAASATASAPSCAGALGRRRAG